MKIINKIKYIIVMCIFLFGITMSADTYSNCLGKKFNIKVAQTASIKEILNHLSNECSFSIIVKDNLSNQKISQDTHSININNMTLDKIFNLLLKENNLNYEYKNNLLKISAYETKIFKIDYITSIREGKATTKAAVDSTPKEINNIKNENEATENADNIITATEKFDFWEKLDSEIKAVLNNEFEAYKYQTQPFNADINIEKKPINFPAPIINPNAGIVTVTATPEQIKRVEKYIHEVQRRLKKQVVIDVSIISIELDKENKTGVDWGKFELGFNSYINDKKTPSSTKWSNNSNKFSDGFSKTLNIAANLNLSLDGVINFLNTNGKTKVISSPKITTLNNQQALITVGDTINYRVMQETSNSNSSSGKTTVSYKQYSAFIGILLNILPEVSDDDKIMLRINPSLSSFKYREDETRSKNLSIREIAPDTLQKKLSTVVRVNNGDTIILGGLIGRSRGKDNTSVPILSDIPVLGNVFKSSKDIEKTTELVSVITPKIINLDKDNKIKQSLKKLGYSKGINE